MVRGLTERDHALFRKLGDFGVLSTPQVKELFFKDIRKTTMLRRLRILEKKELLRRIRGFSDGSHGWCLTLSWGRRLGIEGLFRNTLEYDVTLSQVRLSLESVGLGANWVPEHVLRFHLKRCRLERVRAPRMESLMLSSLKTIWKILIRSMK